MRKIVDKILDNYKSLSEPIKASMWYTICNVLNKGIALLSTPIFTRILTGEQYGTFAIFQSWYSIILIFTSLNMFLGGYSKGLLLFRDDRDGFTSSLLSLTTLITGCFGIAYLCNIDFWTGVLGLPSVLMTAMFIELIVMPAIEFWSVKERFDFKFKKYVIVSLVMNTLSLGVGIIVVVNTSHKLEARVFSDVFVKAIFATVIFVILFIKGKKLFVKRYWSYSLKFNIPLLPHYLSNYVLSQSDRIMIGRMIGNDKAAYYSVVYTISMVMNLLISAINSSLTPYIYKTIDEAECKNGDYQNVKNKVMDLSTLLFIVIAELCILTMAFAPEVIYFFAGITYMEAIYVIPPIAASVFFVFLYSMFSTIEYYYQRTGRIAIATTISAVLNLILNYVFIKCYGYYAAGYTTLICYICLSMIHYVFFKSIIKQKMNAVGELYDRKRILLVSIAVLFFMFVMVFTYKNILLRYGIIAAMGMIVIWKRKYFVATLDVFRKK